MSMEEWPDDHLDELFRKSAEEHDVPFNSADWADMNRRLAEHDRQLGYNRLLRWVGVGALLVLLLGSLTWYVYDGPRNAIPPGPATSQTLAGAPAGSEATARRATIQSVGRASAKTAFSPALTVPAGSTSDKPTLEQGQAVPTNQLVSQSFSASVSDKVLSEKKIRAKRLTHTNLSTAQKRPFGQQESNQVPVPVGRGAVGNGADEAVAVGGVGQPDRVVGAAEPGRPADLSVGTAQPPEPGVVADQSQWLPVLTPVGSQSRVSQQVRSLPEPVPPTNVPIFHATRPPAGSPRRRLSVLLFASPDLSAIGLKNFERPGSNAGLSVQYQLTDRLSIYSGAMLSTKRYQTYSEDYVWPATWTWTVWPSEIMGTCRMIDVPLNVRYDWLLRPRPNGLGPARWFASTGLTSYFIQRETYVYEYDNPNDPNIQGRGWDNQRAGRPGGSFGFSNLNLSVGYERPITRHVSWQVEPFMKVPLQQVGFFRVKLLSTGVFAGLRYQL